MKEALSTTFTGMVTLLVAATLSAAIMGGFSMEIPEAPAVNPFDMALQAEAKGIETVSTGQMRVMVESGSHLILDARESAAFDEAHIPTARSFPIHDFEEQFPVMLPMLSSGMPVVVYCTGPFCDDALRLIERLRETGFPNAVLYLDGMEGWE